MLIAANRYISLSSQFRAIRPPAPAEWPSLPEPPSPPLPPGPPSVPGDDLVASLPREPIVPRPPLPPSAPLPPLPPGAITVSVVKAVTLIACDPLRLCEAALEPSAFPKLHDICASSLFVPRLQSMSPARPPAVALVACPPSSPVPSRPFLPFCASWPATPDASSLM